MTVLTANNVCVTHANGTPWAVPALHDISLRLDAGDRLLIAGGNGSGKSTLLSVLSGVLEPTSGTCFLDSSPVAEQPERVSLVVQNTRLQLMRPTVGEELEDLATSTSAVPGVVTRLGLATILNSRIDELSGGQQRRVGLAGAIVRQSDLVLLDEPMAGLDKRSSEGLLGALELVKPSAIVVVVTHDLESCLPIVERTRGAGGVLHLANGSVVERQDQ